MIFEVTKFSKIQTSPRTPPGELTRRAYIAGGEGDRCPFPITPLPFSTLQSGLASTGFGV